MEENEEIPSPLIKFVSFNIETVSFPIFTFVTFHPCRFLRHPPQIQFNFLIYQGFLFFKCSGWILALFLRNKFINMKIAIALFGNKVSPRFDLSPELWLITEENGKVAHQEKISMDRLSLPQRIETLTSSGVNKLICGGIHDFSLDRLGKRGIDVFHNVIGEAEIALTLCLEGILQSGSDCEKKESGKTVKKGDTPRGLVRLSRLGYQSRLSNDGSERKEKRCPTPIKR
jgi:predicted Fe-Mo cluster-binding NifX family protein